MSQRPAAPDEFAEREFPFTYRDFRQIAEILEQETGIALSDVKAPLVYSRLVRRLRDLGIENFRQYCALVEDEGDPERDQLIAALTTNVTRFFRESHHFTHFTERVLPDLLKYAQRGGKVRFWSAGCSTGEEPYSMALCILSLLPEAARLDVKILATDINKNVLEKAKTGTYGSAAVSAIDHNLLHKYFDGIQNSGGQRAWRVNQELRSLVAFRELNLISDWPMQLRYNAIFCRNVAIYFEESIRAAFWNRFASLLAPSGVLYIGHSERIADVRHRFRTEGNTIYRLVQPEAEASRDMTSRHKAPQDESHRN